MWDRHIFTVLISTKQILNYSEVKEVLSTYPGSKISFHVGNNHNNQGCYWNVSPEHLYRQFYLCHKYLSFIDAALLKKTLQNYRVNIFLWSYLGYIKSFSSGWLCAQHFDTPPSAASQRRAKYRRDSTSIEWSSRETDHSSILTGFGGSSTNTNSPNLGSYGQPVGCPSPALRKNGSIEITTNPIFVVGAENVSPNSSPSLNRLNSEFL